MKLPLLAFVASLSTVACAAIAEAPSNSESHSEPGAGSAASSSPSAGAQPAQMVPERKLRFEPTLVDGRRNPARQECGEPSPPFSADDRFTLQAVTDEVSEVQVKSIVVDFGRTTAPGVTYQLVEGSVGGATFPGGREAHSPDGSTDVTLTLMTRMDQPNPKSVTEIVGATVTVVDAPKSEGEQTTVHVLVEFVGGVAIDTTFSAPMLTPRSACR